MGKTPRLRLRGKRYDALPVSAPLPAVLFSNRSRLCVSALPLAWVSWDWPPGASCWHRRLSKNTPRSSTRTSPSPRIGTRRPSGPARGCAIRLSVRRPPHAGREAVSGLLDDGLSALGPPSDGGHTAADPHRDTLRRTNSEPGWDRRGQQLAHAIRGGGRALALARRSGRPASRVSFARRLPDGGRFPRHQGVECLRGQHA